MVMNLPGEVNGDLNCSGPRLYITAPCDDCPGLCASIQGIKCGECDWTPEGVAFCTCAYP
ncbi:hypothetical protein C5167_041290 [Papaver somniferum]|uniref:Uncharacterized protein n=1 Tax=Papaver somniferum TaxID=3469 RepID=A0A4Y7IJR0_PAPSO|nr:hypothetical protein C5167_041290 [Papaver somniferum]